MEFAGFADFVELAFEADHLIVDGAAVSFYLRLTGAAEEAEATALTLKVGPAPNKPALLVIEMRQFDLQTPFHIACQCQKQFSVVRSSQQIEQAFFIVTGMGTQCIVTGLQIA